MLSTGARIKWKEGNILYPASMWRSPSKRRLPKLLIKDRAMEEGVLITIQEPWVIFQESGQPAEGIEFKEAQMLNFYAGRYYMLPKEFKRQDSYQWLTKPGNALLLWGKDNHFFVKASKAKD